MAGGPAEQISIGRALAKLAVAKAFRTTVQFTHRGGSTFTLLCRILKDWTEAAPNGMGIVQEVRYLKIYATANQTGLAPPAGDPEAVLMGDTCVCSKYANRTYSVLQKIPLDTGGRVYELTLAEQKRFVSGAG